MLGEHPPESRPDDSPRSLLTSQLVVIVAGFLFGFVTGVLSTPPDWDPELNRRGIWVRALFSAVVMAIAFRRIARSRAVNVSKELAVFLIVFLCATMIPWFRSPLNGEYLPIGTAYVNRGFGNVGSVFAAHLMISTAITIPILTGFRMGDLIWHRK